MDIALGEQVRDRLTGFEGRVVCIVHWLYGCVRLGVQAEHLHDGKPLDIQYFDVDQVERVPGAAPALARQAEPMAIGGPRSAPARRPDPRPR